ncbi:hypothetical protein LC668_03040 (plasmid) [Fusobacterium vincentii]|jgi:hypothetical protein|uniref:Uncharacterized protein n=2 Tax=Fusobacterium nucleatum TaxID=851 RepID=A0A133PB75_FUSNU|nr:hypothetical protein [Fusobacterium nucleatum]KXA25834.1 hypothetical protein HMPREF3221_00210 [Fusobacterium nucleatum]MCG6836521.1 hypothetical protein [Fusobacterium nucleatum]MCL4575650.1 hypothetical protein [Fusobacterium nucleatum YWH7056]MCL4582616.1 hypothetical protein [Fusobacterium nucleatum YWH7054]
MKEDELEFVKERRENIFSILNDIFEFGSFLKGDNQEKKKNNKEDKQKSLKNYINSYDKTAKSQEAKKEILQYFCDALNKVTPKNKRYKIKEIEEIFEKIENLYNLSNFLYDKNLKFILGFPIFYSYISKINNFSKKWKDILLPFDLELEFMQLRIKGSFESFYKNNKEIFDESFAEITPQTLMNWRNGKNIISIVSIYKAIKSFENLSQKEEEFFQILYLKRIVWKIYEDMEKKNKEQFKQIIKIFFKIMYELSSQTINSDKEIMGKILKVMSEELNIQNKEKRLFLESYEKIEILDKNLKNSKLDFEKIITNSINRIKFNNNVYKFNDKYNVLKEDYSLVKHKKLLEELENKVQLKNYYEYSYYIYFLVDSYNLLNTKKEKYKTQEKKDSERFLKQLEKKYKGKLNDNKIEEYKENFDGKIKEIPKIFTIILEILPNQDLIMEILLRRISSNEKLLNKVIKYLEENFNITLINGGGEKIWQ